MFSKFIEVVKEAIKRMVGYKSITDVVEDVNINISAEMREAVDKWKLIYKDKSPWLNDEQGIYSLQLGKAICQSMQMQVMCEMESKIASEDDSELSKFLNEQYQNHVVPKLATEIEIGMALGSLIMKPYIVDDKIYIDFCRQGTFVPLAYDDDGNITDIMFPDFIVDGNTRYTRLERQTYNAQKQTILIVNKAYKTTVKTDDDDSEPDRLGTEIPLDSVEQWQGIEEEVEVENVTQSLFGYYKVPLANNIDLDSPLGISVFSPAIKMIQKADEQFSRLDWEYEGGQMAVDVDYQAIKPEITYFGGKANVDNRMDKLKERLYRKVDLNQDETYNVFAPSLRDSAFLSGLDKYLTKIEDLIGLARGSLSSVEAEGRTATEIKILKQRTYITIKSHQEALEKALNDLVYAMAAFASLYELAPDGKYSLNIDWKDSILTDTQEELNQRIQLLHEGIEAKWELRSWYKGEDEATAKKAIADIEEEELDALDDDIFSKSGLLANSPFNDTEGEEGNEGIERGEE